MTVFIFFFTAEKKKQQKNGRSFGGKQTNYLKNFFVFVLDRRPNWQ